MARTSITVTEVPFQGKMDNLTFQAADAANGMKYQNPDGRAALIIKNTGASPVMVTVKAVPDEAGRSVDLVPRFRSLPVRALCRPCGPSGGTSVAGSTPGRSTWISAPQPG